MERTEKTDKVMALGMKFRELDRGLDSFCPRVAQKCSRSFFKRRDLIELFTQLDPTLMIKIRGDMHKFFSCILYSFYYSRISMACGKHGNPRHKINEAIPIWIPHFHTFAMIHYKWIRTRIRRRDDFFITLNQCLSLGARQI